MPSGRGRVCSRVGDDHTDIRTGAARGYPDIDPPPLPQAARSCACLSSPLATRL
jgi:hypothetical protein